MTNEFKKYEVEGVIEFKAKNGRGFKISGDMNWFNCFASGIPFLAKFTIGSKVKLIYSINGTFRNVNRIEPI